MTASTITVRGHKVSNRSRRRYITVHVRPEPQVTAEGTYVAFAHVTKRSDNVETARKAARRHGISRGAFGVVVDTTTGEEIS